MIKCRCGSRGQRAPALEEVVASAAMSPLLIGGGGVGTRRGHVAGVAEVPMAEAGSRGRRPSPSARHGFSWPSASASASPGPILRDDVG